MIKLVEMIHVHVAVVKSIKTAVVSKVNKGIAGFGTIKKSEKRELDTF